MRLTAVRFAILSSALAMAAGFAQAQEVGILAPRQHRPVSIRRVHDDQTAVDSTNWSGYAVTGPASSVTYAAGSWVVPASTCPVAGSHQRATPEYAAFWVGIDGWTSNSVEQIGTDSDCSNGKPSYYAWVRVLPRTLLLRYL